MGVPRRACGGRRSPKKFVLWAVVVVGFFALSVKDVRESVFESPGDGKKETREMMDGNDDGKMMGGADNEGESEIEINEKPKIEKQKVISKIREQKKNGDGDGDGESRQDENNGDHNDDGDENARDNNNDGDNDHDSDNGYSHNEETNINGNIEKNYHKIDQIIDMNEKESENKDIENQRETNIEDKQEKDKDEEEKRENQHGEEVVVNEIKPDQDKPIDKREIDDRNRRENGNSAGEEKEGREEEKIKKEMEEGKDVGKKKGGGGGGGGDGGNEKEGKGKEGNYGEEEKGNGKEKEEGNYEGAEKGNKEDEGKDGRKGEEREKGNKEDEGKDAGKGGGEKENKEGKDRGKGEGEEGEKENKENEGKDAGKGKGAGEGEKDAKEKEEKGKEEEKKEEGRDAPPWKSSVALNGNLARNENLNGRPVVKVLLLAYQRSGSSFTGELLSSGGGAFYVYEPLFQWRHQFGYAPDPAFHQDIPKLLGDLLDCSPEVLNAWKRGNFRHFRRKPEGVKDFCKDASFRLVKTIRARKSHVMSWLLLREDIKVVHLVRDPRGILNSVSHGGNIWTDRNRDAVYQCSSLREDLDLEQLGPQRYLRMRYEDLVDKPLEETTRVFSFMGVPVSSSVLTFLKEHTGMDTAGSPLKQRYMNTFRQADFRHDHWKKELDSHHIRQIEDVCQVVMNFLHYPVLPSA